MVDKNGVALQLIGGLFHSRRERRHVVTTRERELIRSDMDAQSNIMAVATADFRTPQFQEVRFSTILQAAPRVKETPSL
jgi:hypothetical protein